MGTLRLKIVDGTFVGSNGVYVTLIEPKLVVANGWRCQILANGIIRCDAICEYSDGKHKLRYKLWPDGKYKLSLKLPDSPRILLRQGNVLPKGGVISCGVLGLSGGNIDSRYVYFRNLEFQNFLEKHNISAVKHEDPNKCYKVSKKNKKYQSYICTDGEIEVSMMETWERILSVYESTSMLKVKKATWVIHTYILKSGSFSVLYTLENPLLLKGLPE